MLIDYLPIVVLTVLAAALGVLVLIIGRVFGPHRPTRKKGNPYESGMIPYGAGARRMSVRYYLIAVLFILFDVEAVFLLPWAVIFRRLPGITGSRSRGLEMLNDDGRRGVSTVAMRKLEIVALKRDMNSVLEGLGHAGCFQIDKPDCDAASEASARNAAARMDEEGCAKRYRPELDSLEELRLSLDLRYPENIPEGTRLPGQEEAAALDSMRARTASIEAALKTNAEKAARARRTLEEARVFAGLELPFGELDRLSFLTVRIGRVDPEELPGIRASLGDRAIALAVGQKGDIVAISSRRGRFALDTELSRAGFSPRQFSPDFKGVPLELPAALERSLAELDAQRTFLEREMADLRDEL